MKNLSHRSSINIPHWALGLLLLLFFCAPAYASDAPATPTFRSTSPFGINQTIQGATMNNNGIHQGTIYKPFTSDHPYADLNPGSGSGGSSDPNDDVGIPGWADTPSEPLPIGDTLPLFLFAAAMIAIIWIRQRKQQRLTTQTQPTNKNDNTQYMTTRKQTYQSLRQKLFLLLAFVCIAGQVSAQNIPSKIYFRPSTTKFTKGYRNTTTKGNDSGYDDVYWTKNSYITLQVCKGSSITGGTFTSWNNVLKTAAPANRFIEMTVPSGYNGVIAYRLGQFTAVESLYTSWKNGGGKTGKYNYNNKTYDIVNYNTIPKFADSNSDRPSKPEPIPTDGKNLLCNKEGWWDVWYWAYYLPKTNDVKIYFAKVDNWEGRTDVKLLTGKDIYTYETPATTQTISNTKLAYFSLNGSEFGYLDYGFIGGTNTWDDKKTIPSVGGSESNWVYDESSSFANNKTDAAKNSNANQNRIANRRTYSAYYTNTLSNLLSGYNLFIPGKANKNASLTKKNINSWESLNHTYTVTVKGGGKINYQFTVLDGANSSDTHSESNKTGTNTFKAAYTSTIIIRAIPDNGYDFIGFFEEGSNTSLSYTEDSKNPGQYLLYYEAPNADKNITAVFSDSKAIRMQLLNDDLQWKDWNATPNGNTLKVAYTDIITNTAVTYTFDKPRTENTWVYHNKEYIYINNIDASKNITFTADDSQSEYTFIGWWNNNIAYSTNPWSLDNPANYNQSVTARFARVKQQTVNVHTYNTTNDTYDALGTVGGNVSITYTKSAIDGVLEKANDEDGYGNGYKEFTNNVATSGTYASIYNSSVTLTATPNTNYAFLGWYEGENKVGSNTTYTYIATTERNITARFHVPFQQNFIVQTEIGGQYQNSTIGGTATISYNDGTKTAEIGSSTLSIEDMYQGSMNTLTATPNDGYRFVGWYNNSGNLDSSNPTYTYRAEGARTVHARFARNDVQLVVAVMNYNTDYAEFVEYPHDNNTVTIANGGNTTTVTSSTSQIINYGSTVTLTASHDDHDDGYDFIGWYQNNKRISSDKTYTFTITDHSAISAHFAPKQCHKVILYHTFGGQYQVKYARPELFDSENGYYVANSLYNKDTTIFVPYEAKLTIIASTAKPTIGYEYTGYYRISKVTDAPVDGVYTIKPTKTAGGEENTPEVFVEFIRTEDQIVYLDLTAPNAREDWKNRTQYFINVRNIARKAQAGGVTAANIELTKVKDGLYSGTIPGNIYTDVTFYYEDTEGDFKRVSTTPQVIPATRNNCFILNGVYSSTDGWIDGWTTLDTENGDYRLIYREQTVEDKNTIRVDYEFNEGDRIKKRTTTGTDIVSLHIYNKVSSDGINGINNPEVILQQWSDNEDAWVDVERYMVFGPLRSNDASVIKMPNRKNTANEVVRVDLGINNIMTDKTDNGCGVWNFVIEQDGTTARLLVDETRRYEGNYYIRTTNADGQYNNFTHPNNVMTYSEYAKKNSDFSHYFVRYVDIYEDGTKTAEAGKHPVIKFTIANDHAMFLCKEFLIDNNRFTDDEYGDDLFVKNVDGAPNLPVDATVRFGWDIVTNRLTRAYIADTEFKNNEYLIVEGDKIGDISDEKAYFDEIGDHFYQIDLSAQVPSDIKVKAKMNGNYQYFMGSENATDQLIGGQANGSYPVRLLYDFKNDRFITICELAGTINGNINLATSVMIMREHNDAPKQLTFANNDATITATPNVPNTGQDQYTKPAYAVMTFLEDKLLDNNVSKYEKMFYWISFPFDVKISDVFGLGEYGKYWIMEEYDGAQRAQSGLAQTNWKYITKKSHVLQQNVGYVLCLNYSQILQDQLFKSHGSGEFGHSKLSLYFPSNSVISPAMLKGGQTVTRKLDRMENNNTAWNHHNWYLIGVPSFATPGFDSKQDDIPFLYQYWHPGDAYAAVTPNDVTFHAMHSFMVQYYGDITWTSVVNNGGSVSGGKSLAAKKDADTDKKIMLRLELQQAGSTIDKTYVQLRHDKGTKGFDMSLDLTKIINAGANIYSIVDNHEMAGNAIPKDETVLPLGVVITAAGDYTFAMPNGTEGMIVELIDYEQGTSTNLLMNDYTITLNKGTFNQRFALRLVPDKVATSVEDITSGTNDNNVRKLLIDGVLYLVKDGAVYDAQGHAIR